MIRTEVTFESTSKKGRAGDINLHYHEAGEGPVLIALHGSGPGASAWSNFKQNLPDFAEHHRTLLIDQPGFGLSDKPDYHEATQIYFARAVRDLMDSLGIERAHFLGNSMGASVTLRFALDYPDRADKLVLMAGGVVVPLFGPDPSEGVGILREFLADPTKKNLERFVRVMVWDQSFVTPELLEERWKTISDPDNFAGFQRVSAPGPVVRAANEANEIWRELDRVRHHILLIWGRDDRVVPLEKAFFGLRRLANVQLHVFSQCGHWAQVEKQREFDRLVLDFIGGF